MRPVEPAAAPQSWRLALADLWHDRLVSLCQVALVVALFTPLLLLFALKYGIVTTLLEELARNPETLRLRPVGSYHLSPAFFATLRGRRDVAFAMPATRAIAAQIYLSPDRPGERQRPYDVQMLPTGPGDPLGEGRPLADATGGIGLSQAAARQMRVAPGDRLIGRIERTRNGALEAVTVPLHVLAIVPERLYGPSSAFVDLALLVDTEHYRDDEAVPQRGWAGTRPWSAMRDFASFRLYASGLREVAGLAAALRDRDIEVDTEAEQIDGVLALDRNLDILFAAVAAIGGLGLVVALMASMVAGVDRKRRSMAVLSLLGFSRQAITLFPLAQAWTIGAIAVTASILLALAGTTAINVYFAGSLRLGQVAARLPALHAALGALLVLLLITLPAAVAAWRVARIESSEALREL